MYPCTSTQMIPKTHSRASKDPRYLRDQLGLFQQLLVLWGLGGGGGLVKKIPAFKIQ